MDNSFQWSLTKGRGLRVKLCGCGCESKVRMRVGVRVQNFCKITFNAL